MARRRLAGWQAALIGFGVVAIVIAVSVWGAHRSPESFAAWLEAISTFAAFTAASVAVYFAMRTHQVEAERDHRMETARLREQASKVASWYGSSTGEALISGRRTGQFRTQRGVRLRNASDLPVSSVLIALTDTTQVFAVHRVGLLPPGSEPKFEPFPTSTLEEVDERKNRYSEDWEPTAAIAFIDASGNGWARSPMGRLEPVSAETVYDPSHGNLWGTVGLS